MKLNLSVLNDTFSIHRFSPNTPIPDRIYAASFFNITKTDDEISVVCTSDIEINSDSKEPGWACIKVIGPLDFSLTGILSQITGALANDGISLFAVSTFDTDYFLVKYETLAHTRKALIRAGCRFLN